VSYVHFVGNAGKINKDVRALCKVELIMDRYAPSRNFRSDSTCWQTDV